VLGKPILSFTALGMGVSRRRLASLELRQKGRVSSGLIVLIFLLLIHCLLFTGCGAGGGGGSPGGGINGEQTANTAVLTPDQVITRTRTAVLQNSCNDFAGNFETSAQADAQAFFAQMTDEEKTQLAQGLSSVTLVYQSSEGNLRRYKFSAPVNGENTEFLIELRKDKNGAWKVANL
jgi:hypothetical protein